MNFNQHILILSQLQMMILLAMNQKNSQTLQSLQDSLSLPLDQIQAALQGLLEK